MWVWFWIAGIVVAYAAAVSNAYFARGEIVSRTCLQLRAALSVFVALASSLASLSLISSRLFPASGAPESAYYPVAWAALGLLAWLVLLLIFAVVAPIRSASAFRTGATAKTLVLGRLARTSVIGGPARALAPGAPARTSAIRGSERTLPLGRLGRVLALVASRFFVLPVGRVAARIARSTAGPATSRLEEGYARELLAIFSGEPGEAGRSEPLASVVREFARTTVEDIMVPRSAVVAVASSSTLAECVDVFATKRFSRLPVYEGDVESVIGIVHVMDLLKESDLTKTAYQIVRPVPMVPESKRCDELLKEFQKSHGYMAIVLDEYGGTAGLVTVEDVLEELVGEMGHEPVSSRRAVHRLEDGSSLVHAQVEIEKFESATGIKLPRGDYETLAGYLLQEFGRIPEVGASVRREGVTYEVAEADIRKIKLVKVSLETQEAAEPK